MIEQRLRASLGFGALDGNAEERGILGTQIEEAIRELGSLRSQVSTLTRERDEVVERLQHVQEQLDQMAATSIREMEGWTADALRTAIAFERVANAELRAHNHQLRVNLHRARTDAQVARLTKERDEARQHNAELRKQNAVLQNDLDDWAGVPDVK